MSSKKGESPDEYWSRLGEKVLEEVERRLNSGEAKDLPGTLLMRLAELYMKHLAKKAEEEEQELQYMTPMEAIDQDGLPEETKIEILTEYIAAMERDIAIAVNRRKELADGLQAVHEPEPPEGQGALSSEE